MRLPRYASLDMNSWEVCSCSALCLYLVVLVDLTSGRHCSSPPQWPAVPASHETDHIFLTLSTCSQSKPQNNHKIFSVRLLHIFQRISVTTIIFNKQNHAGILNIALRLRYMLHSVLRSRSIVDMLGLRVFFITGSSTH